jgi:pimeloyl-ACP methyl ester carboxylesterase
VNATWMDSSRFFGQAGRVDERRALASRPGLSFVETSGGRVRVRHAPSAHGPRLLFATDGPNVIEHTDALLREFEGKADVVVFEPPGTGASEPGHGFDFTLSAFVRACGDVLARFGPRTLVFPCYLGFIGQQLARERPDQVTRLVTPQTPSWFDMAAWANGVDRRRVVRTPVLGQALVTLRRRSIAATWYRVSTSDRRFREPFTTAANEAFSLGGCFCLASLMQGLERSHKPSREPLSMPLAIPWGAKDRTHRHSTPAQAFPNAAVIAFDDCGHCPDLEDPRRFATWLLDWHGETT